MATLSLNNSANFTNYSDKNVTNIKTFTNDQNIDQIINSVEQKHSTLENQSLKKTKKPAVSFGSVSYADTENQNCKFLPPIDLNQYKINHDPNPEIINKKPSQKVHYNQEVSVLWLRPPSVPKPGDIIVKQLPNRQIAPAPPLVIRQQPIKPPTPTPLVIREAPPNPPPKIDKQLVFAPGKIIPPPPRKVIVERLPPIPEKPQQIFVEKWLPFKLPKRKVVYEKAETECVIPNPKNLIIQWDKPDVEINRTYKNTGVQSVTPEEYIGKYKSELLKPTEFKSIVTKLGAPTSMFDTNSHKELELPELEGDIEALKLIDLDKVGLSGYKHYLNSLGISYNNINQSTSEYGYVDSLSNSNLITMDQVKNILNNYDSGPSKICTDADIREYFKSIDHKTS